MEFLTVAEFKAFEGIKSPEGDAQIQLLVDSINVMVSNILGTDNLTDYVEKTTYAPIDIILDTAAKAADIVVTDNDSNPLVGLSGGKGFYKFTNSDYIGTLNFVLPNPFNPIPADLKLACLQLVKYYRSNEYKASISGAGQSVSYVSLSSNIPRHVLSILSAYRPL